MTSYHYPFMYQDGVKQFQFEILENGDLHFASENMELTEAAEKFVDVIIKIHNDKRNREDDRGEFTPKNLFLPSVSPSIMLNFNFVEAIIVSNSESKEAMIDIIIYYTSGSSITLQGAKVDEVKYLLRTYSDFLETNKNGN